MGTGVRSTTTRCCSWSQLADSRTRTQSSSRLRNVSHHERARPACGDVESKTGTTSNTQRNDFGAGYARQYTVPACHFCGNSGHSIFECETSGTDKLLNEKALKDKMEEFFEDFTRSQTGGTQWILPDTLDMLLRDTLRSCAGPSLILPLLQSYSNAQPGCHEVRHPTRR